MDCPIVFLHTGAGVIFEDAPFNHLNFATLQARLFNPGTDIWVLGDQPCLESLLPFHNRADDLASYAAAIASVRSVYRHLSPNDPEIEMFCIARWFVLREWMQRHGVDRCLHLDSDVLLYERAASLDAQYHGCDIILSAGASAHSSIVSRAALDRFIAHVIAAYTSPQELRTLEAIRSGYLEKGTAAGISDMHFMLELSRRHPDRFHTYHANACDPALDNNIRSVLGFEAREGIKRIEFLRGQPHAFREGTGAPQRHATLHFQGHHKAIMRHHLSCPDEAAALGRPLIGLVNRHWQLSRDAAVRQRTLSKRTERDATRLGAVRDLAREARDHLRKATQSSWLKVGGALRCTSALRSLRESADLVKKILGLSRR